MTRFSTAELREKRRHLSRTDMARLRSMTEAALEKSIREDPDWSRVPRDWHRKAEAVMPVAKRLVSLRLDEDVITWFKSRGAGYQTRMNAVLRSFMNEAKARRTG